MREGKGTKEREGVVGKAAGDECVFIPGEGPGWQMRSGPTPYRTRRAVRYVFYPLIPQYLCRAAENCGYLGFCDWG